MYEKGFVNAFFEEIPTFQCAPISMYTAVFQVLDNQINASSVFTGKKESGFIHRSSEFDKICV